MVSDSLVKTNPEFRWNPARIPARTFPEFQPRLSRNSRQILGGFRWNSAGIHWNYCRHSAGIPLEFQPEFRQNCCRHSAGIALEFQLKFRQNYCRHSTGIRLEFQPGFCLNDCRHSARILLELLPAYRQYSEQLQLEFLACCWCLQELTI